MIDTLIGHGLLTAPTQGWVKNVVRPLLDRTPYRHHWAINEFVKVGYINLYFLKPNFSAETNFPSVIRDYRNGLVGNCAYIGERGIVICDSDFLRAFAYAHGLPAKDTDPKSHELGFEGTLSQRLELVDLWILGHEIGHVLNGDGESDIAKERHLDGTSMDRQTLKQLRTTKDREYAADLAFAKLIALDKKRVEPLIGMLMDLVDAELESRYGRPDVYYRPGFELDYSQSKIAYYFDNDPKQTHPEYIVRAVRILQQLALSTKDSALQGLLGSFAAKFKKAD